MAQTAAAVQAVLDSTPTSNRGARIRRSWDEGQTLQGWYVVGGTDAPGRARSITTTASDSAATQASAILTALRA
jgi:hypothetical protein